MTFFVLFTQQSLGMFNRLFGNQSAIENETKFLEFYKKAYEAAKNSAIMQGENVLSDERSEQFETDLKIHSNFPSSQNPEQTQIQIIPPKTDHEPIQEPESNQNEAPTVPSSPVNVQTQPGTPSNTVLQIGNSQQIVYFIDYEKAKSITKKLDVLAGKILKTQYQFGMKNVENTIKMLEKKCEELSKNGENSAIYRHFQLALKLAKEFEKIINYCKKIYFKNTSGFYVNCNEKQELFQCFFCCCNCFSTDFTEIPSGCNLLIKENSDPKNQGFFTKIIAENLKQNSIFPSQELKEILAFAQLYAHAELANFVNKSHKKIFGFHLKITLCILGIILIFLATFAPLLKK